MHSLKILACFLGLFWGISFTSTALAEDPQDWPVKKVLALDIHGTINPSILRQLQEGLRQHPMPDLVLIKLNTPGGLLSTTREFLTALGALHRPWAVWIAPAGASATSAGAIIAAGAQIIVAAEKPRYRTSSISRNAAEVKRCLSSGCSILIVGRQISRQKRHGRKYLPCIPSIRGEPSFVHQISREPDKSIQLIKTIRINR
ncbi:MAG: hypothetical protein J6Y94_07900, partial [Bacteriovoracaceae bacterium]|nr:hypothetical protein [Bacteriovoracaceae bacterium]